MFPPAAIKLKHKNNNNIDYANNDNCEYHKYNLCLKILATWKHLAAVNLNQIC